MSPRDERDLEMGEHRSMVPLSEDELSSCDASSSSDVRRPASSSTSSRGDGEDTNERLPLLPSHQNQGQQEQQKSSSSSPIITKSNLPAPKNHDANKKEAVNNREQDLVASSPPPPLAKDSSKVWKLVLGTTGIYVAYLYHGNLEEDLFRYRSPHHDQHHNGRFTYVWLLQVVECLAAISVGVVGRAWCGSPHAASSLHRRFWLPGASQLLAKACTSFSMAFGVSFPVVVLAKSAKIVPVMLGQLALGGASYAFRDYLFATLIVCGTALLSSGGERKQIHQAHIDEGDMNEGGYSGDDNAEFQSTAIGLVLICWSLVMDGATAGTQKRLQRQMASNPPTTYDFLVFTNFSMLVFGLAISHWTGDLEHGRAFLTENPDCWTMLMRCCLCSAVGQSFIFYVISVFDPLVLSTVTTTRKIFSVLLSIGFKGHSLTNRGFCGLAMALAGLCIEIEGKVNAKRPAPQQRPETIPKSSNHDDDSLTHPHKR